MNEVVQTIGDWLRAYQLELLHDASRYRIVLKGRQIGVSDAIALEMVLVASGLVELLPGFAVPAHNCTIVSKRDTDAKDVIAKSKEWIKRLRLVTEFVPYLETDAYSMTEIKFTSSGYRIISETQNPDAARSKTGHLYLDEYAFYQFQREIFRSAAASTESRPDLRITIVSTPNGQGDHFHEVWTDMQFYGDWSRHRIDIHRAIEDGMPVNIDKIRSKYTADQFAQEFECSFLGGEVRYFDATLWSSCESEVARGGRVVLGIDTASVVDNTAVQVWREVDGKLTMGDCFVIAKLPYDGSYGRLGQVDIVTAICSVLQPSLVVVDKTGEESNLWTRGAGFYQLFSERTRGSVKSYGVHISRKWKDLWVQKLKVAMQTRTVLVDSARRDLVFSNRAINFAPHEHERIVFEGFDASPFPVLRSDFLKVRRRWVNPNQTTFETERDNEGHGDAFWAAVLGYSGLTQEAPATDTWRKLFDASVSSGSSGLAGSDYADFL